MSDDKTARIRELNDRFRALCEPVGDGSPLGKLVITSGIRALGGNVIHEVLAAVANYQDFTADNDPHGEHDFGSLEIAGQRIFFKIDYFDRSMKYHSRDASDPAQTVRVMTVMLAEEY